MICPFCGAEKLDQTTTYTKADLAKPGGDITLQPLPPTSRAQRIARLEAAVPEVWMRPTWLNRLIEIERGVR